MLHPVKIVIPSDSKFLGVSRKALQHLFCCFEVPDDIFRKLVLCVDEACSNVIKHSYKGEIDQVIEISYIIEEDQFTVKIRDYGEQCDSNVFKPSCLNELKPGGRGTYFINEIMDDVSYCTNREKGTLLTMTKKLKCVPAVEREVKKEG